MNTTIFLCDENDGDVTTIPVKPRKAVRPIKAPETLRESALHYLASGLCAIPAVRQTKRPIGIWREYQNRLPDASEWDAESWRNSDAVCIICGAVSGHLLMIDFDQQAKAFTAWSKVIPPEILAKCVIETSQRGGCHVIVRCELPVGASKKLAYSSDGKILIETRGEGGLYVCTPSKGYTVTQGNYDSIPVLTAAEIESMLEAARSLDELPKKKTSASKSSASPLMAIHTRDRAAIIRRCAADVRALDSSVTNHRGHNDCFHAACVCLWDFGLSQEEAQPILDEFNSKCVPLWSPAELQHKIEDALDPTNKTTERGWRVNETNTGKKSVGDGDYANEGDELESVELADVELTPTKWLWYRRMQLEGITTLAGVGGAGKSTFATYIASVVTRDEWNFYGGGKCHFHGEVKWLTTEASEKNIRNRIEAAGGDYRRVHVSKSIKIDEKRKRIVPLVSQCFFQKGVNTL